MLRPLPDPPPRPAPPRLSPAAPGHRARAPHRACAPAGGGKAGGAAPGSPAAASAPAAEPSSRAERSERPGSGREQKGPALGRAPEGGAGAAGAGPRRAASRFSGPGAEPSARGRAGSAAPLLVFGPQAVGGVGVRRHPLQRWPPVGLRSRLASAWLCSRGWPRPLGEGGLGSCGEGRGIPGSLRGRGGWDWTGSDEEGTVWPRLELRILLSCPEARVVINDTGFLVFCCQHVFAEIGTQDRGTPALLPGARISLSPAMSGSCAVQPPEWGS